MSELRKDYILNRWVILAPIRNKRPHDISKTKYVKNKKTCVFCPGNEKNTPKAILTIKKKGKWHIRVFPNKFPVVKKEKVKEKNRTFFQSKTAVGTHEILTETNNHKEQMWDLPIEDLKIILESYVQRLISLKDQYVLIFKNHGKEAGTSIEHSHSQILGYNKVPSLVQEKVDATKKHKSCPYCEILKTEMKSKRKCFKNKDFVAFTPYASRFPYEIMILPKKHKKNLTEIEDLKPLAEILKKVLTKLKEINAPYNFFIHNAPKGEDLHFQIIVTPRLGIHAGLEIGSNDIINAITPEDAARFYRK